MTRIPRIIVVDDETGIRDSIEEYLEGHGYRVTTADGGEALRRLISRGEQIDLVLLDIRMPGEDGLSLARLLRERSTAGIIMVTASGDTIDRVAGLEIGADDYIAKPFDLRELLARVRSVLRRVTGVSTKPTLPGQVRFGHMILDLEGHRLEDAQGHQIDLSSSEYDLLRVFATHPNRVLSRDQILDLTHCGASDTFDRSIDVRVTRLRRKIETDSNKPQFIKTVRGMGYVFAPDE